MTRESIHPSDENLLLYADGDPAGCTEAITAHIADCAECEARLSKIKSTLADFAHAHQIYHATLSPAEKARAALVSQMREIRAVKRSFFPGAPAWRGYAVAAVALIAVSLLAVYQRGITPRQSLPASVTMWVEPKLNLTPGATLPVTKAQICSATAKPRDSVVPVSLQLKVFALYGVGAAFANYEVDYLITPELGGATDIRNLWPEPYFDTAWNAHAKDQLEDRLHVMVCRGDVDLATAQQDLSRDWIAAYRKYFHTDLPLDDASLRRL